MAAFVLLLWLRAIVLPTDILKCGKTNAAFYFEKLKAKIFAIYKRNML
jgi:hypothetical protein